MGPHLDCSLTDLSSKCHSNILKLCFGLMSLKIRASSICRQYFSEALAALKMKDYQLLCDVDTRWSSTLLMIDRALLLRCVSDYI